MITIDTESFWPLVPEDMRLTALHEAYRLLGSMTIEQSADGQSFRILEQQTTQFQRQRIQDVIAKVSLRYRE